jgi:DNA-binding response OmpR family regulator
VLKISKEFIELELSYCNSNFRQQEKLMNNLVNDKIIWILEDNIECCELYEEILGFRYKTRCFHTLGEFKAAISNDMGEQPSLILADLKLGDGNFLNYLTADPERYDLKAPFIVVSGIDDIDALRFCYKEGALDYLTKPFKTNELLVKIENIFSGRGSRNVINVNSKELCLDGVKVNNLTSKQIQVLSLFLSSPSRSICRADILSKVWGDTSVHPKTVDVHLYNLRRKLHPYGYMIRSEGGGAWQLMSDRIV